MPRTISDADIAALVAVRSFIADAAQHPGRAAALEVIDRLERGILEGLIDEGVGAVLKCLAERDTGPAPARLNEARIRELERVADEALTYWASLGPLDNGRIRQLREIVFGVDEQSPEPGTEERHLQCWTCEPCNSRSWVDVTEVRLAELSCWRCHAPMVRTPILDRASHSRHTAK